MEIAVMTYFRFPLYPEPVEENVQSLELKNNPCLLFTMFTQIKSKMSSAYKFSTEMASYKPIHADLQVC